MQMKYMLSCLFVLFKGFSFLSKFFYLAVVSGRRKEAKGSQEGRKGFNERARRRKKNVEFIIRTFYYILLFFGVNSRYLLCRRDGL